jgi:vanillate O-demethylase ferredoxin subunit
MIRSYSLLNASSEVHRYVVGVNKDPKSRGGSRFLHENLRAGDVITISHPRNNFELDETARHSVFIAGGIGITPLWSMIQRLEQTGASWELYYATRTRKNAAFLEQLQALPEATSKLHLTFDAEPGGVMLDLGKVLATVSPDAHLYCCGPVPMLEAFEKATASRLAQFVHVEYFAAKEKPSTDGGFTVELAQSGRAVSVPPGKTILDTLLDVGIDVPYSCQEGVCGTCEVRVLEGIPDHRDLVLSAAEKASNKTMYICCSGSKTPRLVIDL